ncbi:uncharacterized protein LOC134788776, partial [Penaeus indicus]|uniref:uncharacterized protein LOC134788776 n=1 Tax=Penaeus indicus TaxID=29960 RepID=UPI00300C3314
LIEWKAFQSLSPYTETEVKKKCLDYQNRGIPTPTKKATAPTGVKAQTTPAPVSAQSSLQQDKQGSNREINDTPQMLVKDGAYCLEKLISVEVVELFKMYFRAMLNFFNVFAFFDPYSDMYGTPHPCDEVSGVYSDWVRQAEKVGVVIIGGGVSGLTAAKTLLENNVKNLLILEAKERLGGRVFTVREGDIVVEAGAEWIHGDERNPLYRLAQELNALAPPPPEEWDFRTVSQEGKQMAPDPYPVVQGLLSEVSDNASSLAPYRGLGLGAFFADRYKSLFGEESTEEWKGWLHFLNKIVNSAIGCNDWTTPEVTTTGTFTKYGDNNQWAAGYDTLLAYLKARIKGTVSISDEHIRLSSPVCRIFWDENQKGKLEKGQVLIVSKSGSSWLADHVIVTASFGHLQERHGQLFSPPLPRGYVNALEGMELGVANKLQMGWKEPWWGSEPLNLNIVWTKFDLPEEKS